MVCITLNIRSIQSLLALHVVCYENPIILTDHATAKLLRAPLKQTSDCNKPFQHISFRYRLTYIDRYMLSLPDASLMCITSGKCICIEHGELQLITTQ